MGTQAPENYPPAKGDERTAKEKAIDDWLPITSSRNAKWWYSAFHNVTAMVGAGVLSLPYAMSELGCAGPVMDHYALHAVADGRDARDGAREAVRPVPRARAARVRREARPVDRGPAAARGRGGREHRVHGHRRQVPEEVPRRDLRRQVQGHQDHLLHHDLRVRPLRPLPAPQLQLHLRRLPRRRRHVAQLLDDSVGRVGGQGETAGRGLQHPRDDDAGEGVRLLRRAGGRGVRVRWAQRGARDPGDHPVDAGEAVQEAHVEGRGRRLHRRRALLLPRLARRILGIRQHSGRQHPHHPQQTEVAHRRGQYDGGHPCHWKLPDLRNAGFRHDGDGAGEEATFPSWPDAPSHCSDRLRCLHDVRRHHLPLLRRTARFLWWIRLRTNNLFPSLHHVACNLQAQEVQPLMVHELDLHCSWCSPDGPVSDWRTSADNHGRQDIPFLLVNYY